MKKMTKILFAAGGVMLLCMGSVSVYLRAQPAIPKMSDLTLANIEALSAVDEKDDVVLCPGGWDECATNGTITLFKKK